MRLLVIELSHSAGTRSVMRQIMPKFVNLCEAVYYCGHDAKCWSSCSKIDAISFGELIKMYHGWKDALRKRFRGANANTTIFWSYIEKYIEQKGITHVFLPWLIEHQIPRLSVPSGAMLMDLLWKHFPEEFPEGKIMDATLIANLRNIDIAFPVSAATASEIASTFDTSGLEIATVPHGASLHVDEDKEKAKPGPPDSPFFLYPAQTTENKNHLCLFEAVSILAGKGLEFRIILTSGSISRLRDNEIKTAYETKMRQWVDEHSHLLDSHIDLKGQVSWEELEYLYNTCRAVILPSLYEGFGLPLIEALERNVQVVCSGIGPFQEQINRYLMHDRVVVVDPINPEHLALAMQMVLEHKKVERLPLDELTTRLSSWTWDDAAVAYRDCLLRV
jgi:glycosyltransferase involved in cell wall biosynthesis